MAFVFSASLAWKDTLIAIFDILLATDTGGAWAELLSATLITVVVIVLVYLLLKSDQVAEQHLPALRDTQHEQDGQR